MSGGVDHHALLRAAPKEFTMTVPTPEQAIDRDPGNYFVAMDEPLAHTVDIRTFFAGLR
ncbi:hypothetical protein [Micromonospora violae]|uniref:hypothetical protein n=1 Tax=Micromonospora violae TaxID=1278207 RepID=UPI001AC001FB|nr:hypothetical protein [Micromonospora violae]